MWDRKPGWLGLAVLCLIAVLALSACGGGDDTTSGGGSEEATEAEAGGGEEAGGEEEEAPAEEEEASVEIPEFESVELEAAKSYPEPEKGAFKLAYMNPASGNEFLKTLGTAMKLETEKLGGSY